MLQSEKLLLHCKSTLLLSNFNFALKSYLWDRYLVLRGEGRWRWQHSSLLLRIAEDVRYACSLQESPA